MQRRQQIITLEEETSDDNDNEAEFKESVKTRKRSSVLEYLSFSIGQSSDRRIVTRSRKHGKLLRERVCSTKYKYKKIAEFKSRRPVNYDQNMVYVDDPLRVYTVGCYDLRPKHYRNAPFHMKIKDYLYVQGAVGKSCDKCEEFRCCQPFLLALSVKNRLNAMVVVQLDSQQGYIQHFILDSYSSDSAHIEWNSAYSSAYVSVHMANRKLYKFYYFTVFPLMYRGAFSIDMNMKGANVIKKVVLSMDLLITHEKRDTVYLYSVTDIVSSLSTDPSQAYHINNSDQLGPPLLVVTNCHGFDMQIGGFPYRLLIATTSQTYVIKSIDQQENYGMITPIDPSSVEKDSVLFDETESGQIIQKGEHSIRVFRIPSAAQSIPTPLTPLYKPTDLRLNRQRIDSRPSQSRYGRTLTQRSRVDNSAFTLPTIQCELDLEDELDLLFTLTCDHHDRTTSLYVNILDCYTLQLMKREKLEFTMPQRYNIEEEEVLFPISVSADRDLLIVSWKVFSKHHMTIYQLASESSDLIVTPKYLDLT